MSGFERYCERHPERYRWRNRWGWFYGNTPFLYKPVHVWKFRVFYPLRRALCGARGHPWRETGHWAEGYTFEKTVWFCPRCKKWDAFPMSEAMDERFFGEHGYMRNIKLVEGSISDVLKEVQ